MINAALLHKGIYVDIDAIMDTRLATLIQLDEYLLEHVMKNGYTERVEDIFDPVPKELYKELYRTRDVETLSHAFKTKMVGYIKDTVYSLVSHMRTGSYERKIDIALNTYPYKLNAELREVYKSVLTTALGPLANVNVMYAEPSLITPNYIKGNYSLLIKYDYGEWLDMHAHAFKDNPLPNVSLFVPDIWFKDKPSDEEIEKLTEDGGMHPMAAIEFISAPLIALKLISIAYYCADIFELPLPE